MTDDVGELAVPAADGEIVVAVQSDGVLVGGDPDAVESYLIKLRESAGRAMQTAGVDTASLGNATGLLAGAASVLGQSGKYVQLHPESVKALKVGAKIPGTDGFFRMMTRGADNKFLQQLQWKPAALGPQGLMSVQMVAVQLALKSAIAEVEESVRRVEGKVEQVLKLAQADRAGNVLGTNTTVARKIAYLERHGSLPEADWDSVASLGPALNITIEQLRIHVSRVLDSLDPAEPVHTRADKLRTAVDDSLVGESLSLLVVAEESLHKWQRLRLARVEATEPDHLPKVMQDARELLLHHLNEDSRLYQQAHRVINEVAKVHKIDGFRFKSVKELSRDRLRLRKDLDAFARARRNQVEDWTAMETPSVRDAVDATIKLAKPAARKTLAAAGQGLMNLSERLGERSGEKEPVKDPAPPTTESAE